MTITVEEKAAWAARLRTDDFTQITGDLTDCGTGRCALGVLCEVLGFPLVQTWQQSAYDFLVQEKTIYCDAFWQMNDCEHKSFAEIADAIDAASLDDRMFNDVIPRTISYADH